jgi:hypothetical protein
MFTMIRIMINRPYVDSRRRIQPQPELPHPVEYDDDLKPGNPWKQELERLSRVSDKAGRARFGSLVAQELPQEPAGPQPPKVSSGTLTNLKNWWGSGLNPNGAAGTQASRQFPPKKINRWQQ